MEKIISEANRIWKLAIDNKKATAVVVAIVVFIIISI
jgi:hypothetical protein